MTVGEEVDPKDAKWLARYERAQEALAAPSDGEEIESIEGFGTVAEMEAAAEAKAQVLPMIEPRIDIEVAEVKDEETVTQTFAAADLSFEGEDEPLESGAKIGEVSFGKLEKDMAIFDEEQFVPEDTDNESEPSVEV